MKAVCVMRDQERPHFITCTIVDWIEVFTRKTYRDITKTEFAENPIIEVLGKNEFWNYNNYGE